MGEVLRELQIDTRDTAPVLLHGKHDLVAELLDALRGVGDVCAGDDGKLAYDLWCEGIRLGRNYVADGRSHLIDFTVGGVELGTKESVVRRESPGKV